jgi:hypothetical protein
VFVPETQLGIYGASQIDGIGHDQLVPDEFDIVPGGTVRKGIVALYPPETRLQVEL